MSVSDASLALDQEEYVLPGSPAAPGLARGPLVVWETDLPAVPRSANHRPADERARLESARTQAQVELERLRQETRSSAGEAGAQVFEAQLLMLQDPTLRQKAEAAIQEGLNAEAAWMDAVRHFAVSLRELPDPTLAARAADVLDMGACVLRLLLGMPCQAALELDATAVIAARDLTPSQTASLDRDRVLAFCCAEGGATSHAAILARALELPAVVGLGPAICEIPRGTSVLVDGYCGQVVVRPTPETLAAFEIKRAEHLERAALERASAFQPATTRDGRQIRVVANIGGVEEARRAVDAGADGVGLLRTEFLYLDRSRPPDEDEQTAVYRQIMDVLDGRHLVVRTFDIGGDKPASYLPNSGELNPFLGWRGVRMARERPDLLATQFRALVRAAAGRPLHIMVPMVSLREEVLLARDLLQASAAAVGGDVRVQFGVMIEVPSIALLAGRIAPDVDFFSIGTNDLTQYTLAADRTNARVAPLASPFDPAVLELVRRTILAAHRCGKWVGLCGEFAADPLAAAALVGMDLDEFSVAPSAVPGVKRRIRELSTADCLPLVNEILELSSAQAVRAYLEEHAPAERQAR